MKPIEIRISQQIYITICSRCNEIQFPTLREYLTYLALVGALDDYLDDSEPVTGHENEHEDHVLTSCLLIIEPDKPDRIDPDSVEKTAFDYDYSEDRAEDLFR